MHRRGRKRRKITIYWLIPAKPESELFHDVIRILAKQFKAPRFEPHLTLGVAPDQAASRKVLRAIRARPIRLRIRGIGFSAKFTKTLFVRFNPNRAIEKLIADLGGKKTSLHDPHMSLLYKKLPVSMQRELASAIRLPFREVRFDSIKAVRCISPSKTRADVEAWRVVVAKRLRKT